MDSKQTTKTTRSNAQPKRDILLGGGTKVEATSYRVIGIIIPIIRNIYCGKSASELKSSCIV